MMARFAELRRELARVKSVVELWAAAERLVEAVDRIGPSSVGTTYL
jgi:hypothetical protein